MISKAKLLVLLATLAAVATCGAQAAAAGIAPARVTPEPPVRYGVAPRIWGAFTPAPRVAYGLADPRLRKALTPSPRIGYGLKTPRIFGAPAPRVVFPRAFLRLR